MPRANNWLMTGAMVAGLALPVLAVAQAPAPVASKAPAKTAPQKKNQPPAKSAASAPVAVSTGSVMHEAATAPPKTTVVEQIVARVNDKIITTTDYANALSDLNASLQGQSQSGPAPTPAQIAAARKNLLSQLIDNQLLVQKANDLGMSAETETVMQLDQLRKQNNLATMNDLQKAVEAQGESYQDFEQAIRDQVLQQKVIEQDVAPRVSQPTPQQIAAYYNAHKGDYVTPDEVELSEILINTDGKTAAEKTRLKALADQVRERAAQGEDFATLAKRYSNAASASSGGDIGYQKQSELQADLAKTLFALPVGGVSPVETVANGYLILRVNGVHHAGQETLQEATNNITNILYQQKLRPELNRYLDTLRQQAYITVKPGYVDTGASEDTSSGPDITQFQRVLPSDLPKPTAKDKANAGGMSVSGQ